MKLTTAAQMKELDRQAIEERGIPSMFRRRVESP